MDDVAWQTVAEVADRMHRDLDRPWTLELASAEAGYDLNWFANLFRRVVGEPPAAYCRRLRLERAAYELLIDGRPAAAVGARAGYASGEAFSRAFKRQHGVSPRQARDVARQRHDHAFAAVRPDGLDPDPEIAEVGPLSGWTAIVPSFAPADVAAGLGALWMAAPPDGAWQLRGVAQPWGWLLDGPQELRCLRRFDDPSRALPAPPPPLAPWRWPRAWFATFAYEGPQADIAAACMWMAARWPRPGGPQAGYGPLVSLLEDPMAPVSRARLLLPITPPT